MKTRIGNSHYLFIRFYLTKHKTSINQWYIPTDWFSLLNHLLSSSLSSAEIS